MKKALVAMIIVGTTAAFATAAQAGSIDYLTNQSADYIRTFSRNSSTDAADIASFNPAGTAWMEDGLYFNLASQTVFKDFGMSHKGEDFRSSVPTWSLPSFYAVYKWQDLAAFASFTVPAGGGSLEYDDGVPFLVPLSLTVDTWQPGDAADFNNQPNGSFKGSSVYLSPAVGAAYRFFDIFSVSAAGRMVLANKSFEGSVVYGASTLAGLDADKSATGFGGVFGLHVSPIKGLDIAARYEMEVPLEFETSSTLTNLDTDGNALSSFADGAKEERPLPAVLAAGIGYRIIDDLRVSVSFNYYFIEQADDGACASWLSDGDDYYKCTGNDTTENPDGTDNATGYAVGYDDDYGNGYDIAGAVEYNLLPELVLSVGYNHGVIGGNEDTYNDFEYALDSNSVGLGGRYSVIDDLAITLAGSGTFYTESKNKTLHPLLEAIGADVEAETFTKTAFDIALGVEWKAL